MRKTKAKQVSSWAARRLPFAVLWAISMWIIGVLSRAFLASNPFNYLTLQQVQIILTLLFGGVMVMVQVQLVERLLKRSMRGWLVYTMLGSFVSLFLSLILQTPTGLAPKTGALMFFILGLTPMLLQGVWLWKRVHRAWLWPLIMGTLSAAVNVLYVASPELSASPFAWVVTLIFGLIQGSLMHTLWTHARDDEKAKVDFAEDEEDNHDHERMERLQERERTNALERDDGSGIAG